jgi:hypothetical protein
MDRIAEYLTTHETIEREQFADIVGMPPANAKNVIKKPNTNESEEKKSKEA